MRQHASRLTAYVRVFSGTWTKKQASSPENHYSFLRRKVIGCGQFFMYVGQAFAQLLAGALYTYVSPQLPFILLAASAFPLSIIAYLKISDPSAKEV